MPEARDIKVFGSYSEVVVSDKVIFTVTCSSNKPSVQEARESVDKRQEYIVSSCQHENAKDIKENSYLTKTGEMYTFKKGFLLEATLK